MIVWASGLGMGVGKFSRGLRGVGVLAIPETGLDKTRCIESVCEVPLGAGVLRLLVPGMVFGVIIDCRCAADGVIVTRGSIYATLDMFSEDEGVEF